LGGVSLFLPSSVELKKRKEKKKKGGQGRGREREGGRESLLTNLLGLSTLLCSDSSMEKFGL